MVATEATAAYTYLALRPTHSTPCNHRHVRGEPVELEDQGAHYYAAVICPGTPYLREKSQEGGGWRRRLHTFYQLRLWKVRHTSNVLLRFRNYIYCVFANDALPLIFPIAMSGKASV